MLEIAHFSFSMTIVAISMLGYGLLLYKDLKKYDLFFILLTGYFLIGLSTLFLHFFFPISKYFSIVILSLGIFFFIYNFNYLNQLKLLKLLIFYNLVCLILLCFANHAIDSNMYHHSYVSYLNSEKIIFGIAEVQFRFGHISFLQYVQAITNNDFLHEITISAPNIILFSFFIFYCSSIILKQYKKKIVYLLTILICSFILIKLSRYREFGNDLIPLLITSYLLIKIFDHIFYKNFDRTEIIKLFPLYSIFIFSHKISYIFSSLIFLTIIKKNDLFKIFKNNYTFILFLAFSSFWIAKNIINTSCIAYPVVFSCLENTSWYLSGTADPKNASWLTELWAKDFITKDNWKDLNLDAYINSFQWVPNWLENHFVKILEKVSPLLLVCVLITIFLFTKKNTNKKKNIKIYNKQKLITLLFLIIIGLTVWFLNAPVFRYGAFYIISFISVIYILVMMKFIENLRIKDLKKIKIIFFISIAIFVFKNLDRQFSSSNNLFPVTSLKINEYKTVIDTGPIILKPVSKGVCYLSPHICSHEVRNNISFKKKSGYYFLNKNN